MAVVAREWVKLVCGCEAIKIDPENKCFCRQQNCQKKTTLLLWRYRARIIVDSMIELNLQAILDYLGLADEIKFWGASQC